MKFSVLLGATAATLCLAGPLVRMEKRALVTDVVIEVVTVTVTDVYDSTTVMGGPAPDVQPTTVSTTSRSTTSISTTSTSITLASSSTSVAPTVLPPSTVVVVVTPSQPKAEAADIAPSSSSVQPASSVVSSATASSLLASSSVVPQAALASPTDYASTAVYHHNIHRFNHSAPAISWNQTYANYSQQVAETCIWGHNLSPGGGGYGQNIAMWASSGDAESLGANTAVAQAVTDMWYNGEIRAFPTADYGMPTPDMTNFEYWGHFSQVIWVRSIEVGCYSNYCAPGSMNSDMGTWFTVCDYYPAGNVGSEYGLNVLPPLGEPTVTA